MFRCLSINGPLFSLLSVFVKVGLLTADRPFFVLSLLVRALTVLFSVLLSSGTNGSTASQPRTCDSRRTDRLHTADHYLCRSATGVEV